MTTDDRATLDARALTEHARAHYGEDGRLPAPEMAEWDIFPFEGELLVKHLSDPVVPEPARHGETQEACSSCAADDDNYQWTTERWRLLAPHERQPMPTFLLETRAHLDLGDLDDSLAGELGRLVVRIERAIAAVPGVGRVHVNRWGDGGAHLHLWFFARPEGMLQLRGSCLPDWLDVLPPMPEEQWHAVIRQVVANLEQPTSA